MTPSSEVAEVCKVLTGNGAAAMGDLCAALGGVLLADGGLARDVQDGANQIARAIRDGRAAEVFGAMIAGQGGPRAFMENWARLATGREPVPSKEILGLRYQALEADLRRAKKLRGWHRISEIVSCLAETGRSAHPILSVSDPVPTVHYLKRLGLRQLGKGMRSYDT